MEFKSPPTSLTEDEQRARAEFGKRLDFVHDLADAGQFLKFQWMHTEVSLVPLEIKYHILEDDPIKARAEFEARSEHLEVHHETNGCRFKTHEHRHESTTQHFAELTFGTGTVKYVVVWIEKDVTSEQEPTTMHHYLRVTGSNFCMHGKCDCGETIGSIPSEAKGQGVLKSLFDEHVKNAEVTK